ncbi:hypothetical protein ACMHYB_58105 [Sorangium sp. So ce1128]
MFAHVAAKGVEKFDWLVCATAVAALGRGSVEGLGEGTGTRVPRVMASRAAAPRNSTPYRSRRKCRRRISASLVSSILITEAPANAMRAADGGRGELLEGLHRRQARRGGMRDEREQRLARHAHAEGANQISDVIVGHRRTRGRQAEHRSVADPRKVLVVTQGLRLSGAPLGRDLYRRASRWRTSRPPALAPRLTR